VEFEFDEDQRLLQQLVRETVARSRSLSEDQLWSRYLELGWLEAPPVELAIILEELGHAADSTPFLATATWFAPLAGRLPQGSGNGSGTAVADGTGRHVLDGDRADEVAVLTEDGVKVVGGGELRGRRLDVFDPRLHLAHLDVSSYRLATGVPDLTLMGLAASTVGSCRRILDLTLEHIKQRHQFGRPIGSFQALKHKAADMYLAIERARVLTLYSALTIAEEHPDRTRAAHMAKAAAGECRRTCFTHGLQSFGAMGMTWECELQIHLKRAAACDILLGPAPVHRKALLACG
jgi:hypothetical protein